MRESIERITHLPFNKVGASYLWKCIQGIRLDFSRRIFSNGRSGNLDYPLYGFLDPPPGTLNLWLQAPAQSRGIRLVFFIIYIGLIIPTREACQWNYSRSISLSPIYPILMCPLVSSKWSVIRTIFWQKVVDHKQIHVDNMHSRNIIVWLFGHNFRMLMFSGIAEEKFVCF